MIFRAASVICLGVLSFLALFGLESLNGDNVGWLNYGDMPQYVLGWIHFINSELSFPLGQIDDVIYPFGSSLAFHDVFPGFSVLVKSVVPSSVLPRQIIGYWALVCCILQSCFGYLLLRNFRLPFSAALLGCGFLLLSPPWIYRFDHGHAGLFAHGLVLASLVIATSRLERFRLLAWQVLIFISCSIHVYIAAMVVTVCLADTLGRPLQKLSKLSICLLALVTAFGTFYIFGYFSNVGSFSDGGFRYFSADVFGFFNSQNRSSLIPGRIKSGQVEGISWFGLGGIALFLFALITSRLKYGSFRATLAQIPHKYLLISLMLMFLFSLSSNVRFFGNWWISLEFFYDLIPQLTGMFRAPGRFIWPLFYYMLTLSVVWTYFFFERLQFTRFKTHLILALALGLQIICQYPFLYARGSNSHDYLASFKSPFWHNLNLKVDHLALVPPHYGGQICSVNDQSRGLYRGGAYAPFAFLALEQGLTFNSGARARPQHGAYLRYCQKLDASFREGKADQKTVYVIADFRWNDFKLYSKNVECRLVDSYHVCVHEKLGRDLFVAEY